MFWHKEPLVVLYLQYATAMHCRAQSSTVHFCDSANGATLSKKTSATGVIKIAWQVMQTQKLNLQVCLGVIDVLVCTGLTFRKSVCPVTTSLASCRRLSLFGAHTAHQIKAHQLVSVQHDSTPISTKILHFSANPFSFSPQRQSWPLSRSLKHYLGQWLPRRWSVSTHAINLSAQAHFTSTV